MLLALMAFGTKAQSTVHYGTFRCNDSVVNRLYREAKKQFTNTVPPYLWQRPTYYYKLVPQRMNFIHGKQSLENYPQIYLYPFMQTEYNVYSFTQKERYKIEKQLKHYKRLADKGKLTLYDMDPTWQQRSAGYSEANTPDSNLIASMMLYEAAWHFKVLNPFYLSGRKVKSLYQWCDSLNDYYNPLKPYNPMGEHPLYVEGGTMGNGTLEAMAIGADLNLSPDIKMLHLSRTVLLEKGGNQDIGPLAARYLLYGLPLDEAWLLLGNRVARNWTFLPALDTVLTPIWQYNAIPFLFSHIAGLEAGIYKPLGDDTLYLYTLCPNFGLSDLTFVEATYETPKGTMLTRWEKRHGMVYWHIEIPPQCKVRITLMRRAKKSLMPRDYTSYSKYEEFGGVFSPNKRELTEGVYDFSFPYMEKPYEIDEFVYNDAPFEQCHAATIEQTSGGDLLSAFYGGHHEGDKASAIWLCRKAKGSDDWSAPQRVAGGNGVACWNPVLYQIPDGDMLLFYKQGTQVSKWSGWLLRSSDGGQSWGEPELLPEGLLGPAKNKPIFSQGRIICPASDEKDGWHVYFEYSDDTGRSWQRTPFVEAPGGIEAIQPSIIQLKDGRLIAYCRTKQAKVAYTISTDNGNSWSPLKLSGIANNNSGIDVCKLSDSAYYMVCNNWPIPEGMENAPRTPLSLLFSNDGFRWKQCETLENSNIGEYSYPSIIATPDGRLQIVYTWRRQRIKYVRYDVSQ